MERKLGENYRYQCQASQDVAPSLAGCTLKKGGCPTLGNMEIQWVVLSSRDFPSGAVVRNSPANAGDTRDTGLIPGLGRSLGVGNGNPLQYSCLEKSKDREAWRAIVQGVTKSRTQLNTHACTHLR